MLAFADDAALARVVIAATRIPHRVRAAQSCSYDRRSRRRSDAPSPCAPARRHAARQRAGLLRHL